MVHLLNKSHLKTVFLCAKYNGAFSFSQNSLTSGLQLLKKISLRLKKKLPKIFNKFHEIPPKKVHDYPKNMPNSCWPCFLGVLFGDAKNIPDN